MLTRNYCLALYLFTAFTLRGGVVLVEDFSYPDGPLETVAADRWKGHSGGANQVTVAGGAVELSQSETQDMHALLEGQPYSAGDGVDPVLFAAFTLSVNQLPSVTGAYFAHFKDRLAGFRGRIWVLQDGAAAGTYRLGISSGSGTAPGQVLERDLELSTAYRIVVRLRVSDGVATVWLNPATEEDAGISSDPSSPIGVAAFALRQASGVGRLVIDDLVVGTSFADVVSGAAPPSAGDGGSDSEPDSGGSEPPPIAGGGDSSDDPDGGELSPGDSPPPDDEKPAEPKAPVITAMPQSQTVELGGTASFVVSATGMQPLQIQWRFNGTNIVGATNAVLELRNVTQVQEGEYRVFVANAYGTAISPGAHLTVTNPPPAAPVEVTIRFTASAEPRLEWKAEAERTYSVLYSDEASGPYRPLAGELHFSSGAGQFVDLDRGRGPTRFYRVTAK